jgi:hypothetical protein
MKNLTFCSLKVNEEKSRIRSSFRSQTISLRYESADPDLGPHQNVTDPQHFH